MSLVNDVVLYVCHGSIEWWVRFGILFLDCQGGTGDGSEIPNNRLRCINKWCGFLNHPTMCANSSNYIQLPWGHSSSNCFLLSIIEGLGGGFKYVLFSPRKLGKIPNLTNIFQMGWNHQPEGYPVIPLCFLDCQGCMFPNKALGNPPGSWKSFVGRCNGMNKHVVNLLFDYIFVFLSFLFFSCVFFSFVLFVCFFGWFCFVLFICLFCFCLFVGWLVGLGNIFQACYFSAKTVSQSYDLRKISKDPERPVRTPTSQWTIGGY